MDELAVLTDVTTRLATAGIPYMLTGSLALSYYTQLRMTWDIDPLGLSSAGFRHP
jgi:hypothetical protein